MVINDQIVAYHGANWSRYCATNLHKHGCRVKALLWAHLYTKGVVLSLLHEQTCSNDYDIFVRFNSCKLLSQVIPISEVD